MGDFWERLKVFTGFANTQLFTGCFWGLILLFLFALLQQRKRKNPFSAPGIVPSFGQLSSFEHVVLLQVDSLDNLKEYGLTNIEDTLIYVQNDFSRPKDVCKTIIKENPGLQDFEKPFSSEYMEVYHDW